MKKTSTVTAEDHLTALNGEDIETKVSACTYVLLYIVEKEIQ